MVDVIHSIQECPCQFVALLPKHFHKLGGIKLFLVVIIGVDKECCLKYDVDTLVIKLCLISHHLLNGPSILLQTISFRFGWMNCNPFAATLVRGSQGHFLCVESYFLLHRHITLLYLCHKRLVLWNGGVTLNETLLNCSIATLISLPLI